jgi:hypothetical protein
MSTIDRAAIPEVPADGRFVHTDRAGKKTPCILRRNLLTEFTPLFLDKWKKRNHPAIGRRLTCVHKRFRRTFSDGTVRVCNYEGFAEEDVNAIRAARKKQLDPKIVPLADRARQLGLTPQAFHSKAHAGKLPATTKSECIPRIVQANLKGKVCTFVQFAHVRCVQSDQLKRDGVCDDLISFPDCARQWGIDLARFHAIVRKSKVLLPDVTLKVHEGYGFTAHGKKRTHSNHRAHNKAHYRPLKYLSRQDFAKLTEAWEEAKAGRLRRGNRVYLSPPTIATEYKLPENTPPSMTLRNRAAYAPSTLGREMDSIDGPYLAAAPEPGGSRRRRRSRTQEPGRRRRSPTQAKLTRGQCWLESDLEVLFPRKKPKPAVLSLQRLDAPVMTLAAIGSTAVAGQVEQAAGKPAASALAETPQRNRPSLQRHLKWRKWRDSGMSYGQIMLQELAESGQEFTREAVIQALRRLKPLTADR